MHGDEGFLIGLYASTRHDIDAAGWDEAQRLAFFKMQYEMRSRWFAVQWPNAEHKIIIIGNEFAGAILTDRSVEAVTLIDIAVSPEFQRKGIARTVLLRLQDEAKQRLQPIRLKVDKANTAAIPLYKALGFEPFGETELLLQMEWQP